MSAMRLWELVNLEAGKHRNENRRLIIRASHSFTARLIASRASLDEGLDLWQDRDRSTCEEAQPSGVFGILCVESAKA